MYRGWRSDSAFSAKGVPRDFLWRGLDGTEVMTSRGAGMYYGVNPGCVLQCFNDYVRITGDKAFGLKRRRQEAERRLLAVGLRALEILHARDRA